MDAFQIINTLGRHAIAERVGVTIQAVDAARRSNRLPAAWYVCIKQMAAEQETPLSVPDDAFAFKGTDQASA